MHAEGEIAGPRAAEKAGIPFCLSTMGTRSIEDVASAAPRDIVAALCAGAQFVLIGRAYLYGLMAGGQQGVERVIELLANEVEVTMQLMGAGSIKDLTSDKIRRRRAPATEL